MNWLVNETPKRLEPTKETVRYLFAVSGNLCAFPGCNNLMLDVNGQFIGQICHIEAALPAGERFNKLMSNEQRRSPENLMLMCYEHHVVTNSILDYPVERLREIKSSHESRFSHPDRAILATLADWTKREVVSYPSNISGFNEERGWGMDPAQERDFLETLTAHIENFKKVPIEVRHFFGKAVERIVYMQDANSQSNYSSVSIPVRDIENALRISASTLSRFGKDLEFYHLGEISESVRDDNQWELFIFHVGDAPFWPELCQYAFDRAQAFENYYLDLNFSGLEQ